MFEPTASLTLSLYLSEQEGCHKRYFSLKFNYSSISENCMGS